MGAETFTLTLDDQGNSIAVTINDTSITPPTGEEVFTTNGTFTVPDDIYVLDIFMVGGGGGGQPGQYSYGSGGGGGGGNWTHYEGVSVQPGDTFTVVVGQGGSGGSVSTNSPFEIVTTSSSSGSTKYPQAGTVTNATNGGNTTIKHNVAEETDSVSGTAGGGLAASGTGGTGGSGGAGAVTSLHLLSITTTIHTTIGSGTGRNKADEVRPGGGGGPRTAGDGGYGRGDFYRSSGGFNYYKASPGGDGGGVYLNDGTNQGANGTDAPPLGTSNYNYTGAGDGGNGGTAVGNAYGAGGGGGAGGRIRNQTIISGGTNYYYRWFLSHAGQNGGNGAVRFAWGA